MCRVCGAPIEHFGKSACSACTAFFKRTKESGHSYPCREGTRKCELRIAGGSICRGCRYDKCIEIGMKHDGPKRIMKSRSSPEKPRRRADSLPDRINSSTTNSNDSLLKRIAHEHAACTERRRNKERELTWSYQLPRIASTDEEVYLTNHECAEEILRISVIENWQFLVSVFPSIGKLKNDDKRVFFRKCIPQFFLIDCLCRTRNIFGGLSQYAMSSVLTCTDLESPEKFIGEDEGAPNSELIEWIRAYNHAQKALILTSFDKLDIYEMEIYALLALLLVESDSGIEHFTDRLKLFVGEIRCEILGELRRFYTNEMELSDHSTRLGNLLAYCRKLNESQDVFQEFFRMHITIFDNFVMEKLMSDLLF